MHSLKDKLFEPMMCSELKLKSNKAEQALCSGLKLENIYGFAQRSENMDVCVDGERTARAM